MQCIYVIPRGHGVQPEVSSGNNYSEDRQEFPTIAYSSFFIMFSR